MTIKPFAAKKQQPQQTDFKIHKSVTRRFRMLGYSGLSIEKLIVRVLDVIDNHPEIKEEIVDYYE